MKWTDNLTEDVYIRLCECRNIREDLTELIRAREAWHRSLGHYICREDVVIEILEWVGDWNGQYDVTDVTPEEYDELLNV